jgi:hypothetical protein
VYDVPRRGQMPGGSAAVGLGVGVGAAAISRMALHATTTARLRCRIRCRCIPLREPMISTGFAAAPRGGPR